MNAALWVAQGILALAFAGAGGIKVFAYDKYRKVSEKNGPSGVSHALATFIGIAELAGAFGVVVPMAVDIAPWLSAWAAAALATVMLLAVIYHLRRREMPGPPAVLLLLAAFVAAGRFSHWH